MISRLRSAKGSTDLADVYRLLLAFPELKTRDGLVADHLRDAGAPVPVLEAWREIAAGEIVAENDDEGY